MPEETTCVCLCESESDLPRGGTLARRMVYPRAFRAAVRVLACLRSKSEDRAVAAVCDKEHRAPLLQADAGKVLLRCWRGLPCVTSDRPSVFTTHLRLHHGILNYFDGREPARLASSAGKQRRSALRPAVKFSCRLAELFYSEHARPRARDGAPRVAGDAVGDAPLFGGGFSRPRACKRGRSRGLSRQGHSPRSVVHGPPMCVGIR